MATKHSVVLAAGVAAAFVASSAAFGVANGVFASHPADEIGHYEMNARVSPTTRKIATTTTFTQQPARTIDPTAPPRVTRTSPLVTAHSPASTSTPSVHVTVTTAPPHEYEHEDGGTEHDDD